MLLEGSKQLWAGSLCGGLGPRVGQGVWGCGPTEDYGAQSQSLGVRGQDEHSGPPGEKRFVQNFPICPLGQPHTLPSSPLQASSLPEI